MLLLLEQHSNLHSYVPHVISDVTAYHFGIPPAWFYELVKYARLWTHLYVLAKPPVSL